MHVLLFSGEAIIAASNLIYETRKENFEKGFKCETLFSCYTNVFYISRTLFSRFNSSKRAWVNVFQAIACNKGISVTFLRHLTEKENDEVRKTLILMVPSFFPGSNARFAVQILTRLFLSFDAFVSICYNFRSHQVFIINFNFMLFINNFDKESSGPSENQCKL